MAFHRLGIPMYFIASGASLLAGYDYLNNAETGTPAMADGIKPNGPNLGTYFVAFGEDGTSHHANRANKALGQNTDVLDDLMHRDLAIPKVTADATSVAPVSSFDLTDAQGIFVGVAGTPNNANGINTFVELLDQNNNEIIGDVTTGARSRVTAISGAAVGAGFAGPAVAVTFTVSPAIPVGVTYRIHYAARGNLAVIPPDGLSFVKIRAAQERDAATIDFENQISRRSGVNVDALVASAFETPNGIRRPKSSAMSFDVDPDGSNGGVEEFFFRAARDGTPDVLGRLFKDPADTLGLTRRFQVGSDGSNGFGTSGTLAFWDAQSIAGGTASGIAKYIPFSGSAGQGDDYLRVHDKRTARSVLRSLNARAYVSVGDGTVTFGDFNGASAIADAIAAFGATGTLFIQVKPGIYAITAAPSIPATLNVVLQGSDKKQCILEGNTGDGHTFNVTGGRLIIKQMTVRQKAAAVAGGIYVDNGWVRVLKSNIVQQKFTFANSNPRSFALVSDFDPNVDDPTLFIDDSVLDMNGIVDTTGVFPVVHLAVGDSGVHAGYIIRDSLIRCTDHNAVVRVTMADGATQTRVQQVILDGCTILLASTTAVNARLAANCGVFWADPGDTQGELELDDIRFQGCTVYANHKTTGTVSMLLDLGPYNVNYDGAAEPGTVAIGRISILGGYWAMPDVDTAITGFQVFATQLYTENVLFRATSANSGQCAKHYNIAFFASGVDTSGEQTQKWGAFVFRTLYGYAGTLTDGADMMRIRNVEVRNVRMANAPFKASDVCLWPDNRSCVDGVTVTNLIAGGVGNNPVCRIRMKANTGGRGILFQNVVWGDSTQVLASDTWATHVFELEAGSESKYVGCGVHHPPGSAFSASDGIFLATGMRFLLVNCFAYDGHNGLAISTALSAGHVVRVLGGEFSFNKNEGIAASPNNKFYYSFQNVRMAGNVAVGIDIQCASAVWSAGTTVPGSYLQIVGCTLENNNDGSQLQGYVLVTTAGKPPRGVFSGNVVLSANTGAGADESGSFRFALNGGPAFDAGLSRDWMAGVHTDHNGGNTDYADGFRMLMNYCILQNG